MSGPVITTIAAKNYLAHVRVLCRSFLAHHPDGRCIALLSDRSDGYVNAEEEPFELIEAEALGVPEFESLAFKYDILELSTALKPYLLSRLLDDPNVDKLVYFDPDILVTRALQPLFSMLDDHEVLLTPHLTQRFDDAKRPNELDILRAGTHNLGFIALRQSGGTRELLDWWKEQCFDGCRMRPEEGYFVDQRWLDLAPTMFSGVHVVRHPGWNVAYWNLHERKVIWGDDPRSNGEPLYFFHFSGFDVRDPHAISKHQNRFRLEDRPDLVELFSDYRKRLLDDGHDECATWPLAFDHFDDGTPIDSLTRGLYRSLEPHRRSAFGNPFETAGARSFLGWCKSPADLSAVESRRRRRRRRRWRALRRWVVEAMRGGIPIVNNRMYQVYLDDPDFRDISPDLAGAAHPSFLDLYRRREKSRSDDPKLDAPSDPLQEELGSEHPPCPKAAGLQG